jgi:hypothetical protein
MQSASHHRSHWASLLLSLTWVALTLVTACSPSKTKEPATIGTDSALYSKIEGMVAVDADPFVQAGRQEEVFGEDLWALSVLPIQIMVRNNGEHPIRIEARNFKLSLPTAELIAPKPAAEVTKWLASQGGILGQVGMGIGQLGISQIGQFAGPFGGIAGAVASGFYGLYRSHASREHDETYHRGELKGATLEKNQFNRGFIFFMLPTGTPAFDEATLSLSIFENQAETSRIDLPLKALGYKGTATK